MLRMVVYPCCLENSSQNGLELEKSSMSQVVPDSLGQSGTMIEVFALNDMPTS